VFTESTNGDSSIVRSEANNELSTEQTSPFIKREVVESKITQITLTADLVENLGDKEIKMEFVAESPSERLQDDFLGKGSQGKTLNIMLDGIAEDSIDTE
jgi:hypothetical protein